MPEFSPGPWRAVHDEDGSGFDINDATDRCIAYVFTVTDGDAHLIAAAPELLAMLKDAIADDASVYTLSLAQDLIDRIEGKAGTVTADSDRPELAVDTTIARIEGKP
jgi:hypothetical protein